MRGRKAGLKSKSPNSRPSRLSHSPVMVSTLPPSHGPREKRRLAALSAAALTETARSSRARRVAGEQVRAGESERAEAFRLYLLDHSQFSIAKALGVSIETIRGWKRKGGWERKRQTCFDNAETRVMRYVEEKNEDSIRRHNVIAIEMQRKGLEYLDGTPPETLGEVIRLLEVGVKMERAGRGLDAKGNAAGAIMDGLLSGDIIAAAVERQRVMLVRRTGPDSGPVYEVNVDVPGEEAPDGTTREETPPTP